MAHFYALWPRVAVLFVLCLLTGILESQAQLHGVEVTSQSGTTNPSYALGSPDGYGAELFTNGNYLVLELSSTIPAGAQYQIKWKMRSGEAGNAQPYVYESIDGGSFNINPSLVVSSSTSYITSSYTASQNMNFIKILKQNPYGSDFYIDAITYTDPLNQADLVSTCIITGYDSPSGRIFWIPNYGTDFKAASQGVYLDRFSDGSAHMYGVVQRIGNSDKKFLVSLWFKNESTYAEWINMGFQAHSPELGNENNWTFYQFDENLSNTLIGLNGLAGTTLYIHDTGSGYGLQLGNGANALNNNNSGISTWFDYTGSMSGNGDINGTYNCGPGACNNVTNAGSICCDQTGCAPFNPSAINNATLPSGGAGAIEYVWLSNTSGPDTNGATSIFSNTSSYDPGVLTQTTWFRRCARRVGCDDFAGESNWVKITVTNCPCEIICPAEVTLECDDNDHPEFTGYPNLTCNENAEWNWNDEVSGTCPKIVTRTFSTTHENESYSCVQILTVVDEEAPVFDQTIENISVSCDGDIPAIEDVTATDNCDENVEITFTEEIFGSDPQEQCEINDGDLHTLYISSIGILPNCNDRDFMTVSGSFETYPDGTARFFGLVANQQNNNQRFAYEVWLRDESSYADWTSIPNANTPSGYREAKLDAGTTVPISNQYLGWTYYIIDDTKENKLIGEGAFAGIQFDIHHAPADYRWGVQVGDRASLQSYGNGLSTWMTLVGQVNGQWVSSASDFNFRLDDCVEIPQEPVCTDVYTIVRTWTATDDCGNSTSETQTITVGGDDVAPEFEEQTSVYDLNCNESVPYIEPLVADNCDDQVDLSYSDSGTCNLDIVECEFRTYTIGGWGAPANGNNPGVYRDANFDGAFPDGLTIGCDNTFTLTNAQAVEDYLPGGGNPSLLPNGNLQDPGNAYNNTFASQLIGVTLALGFDAYDENFAESNGFLGDQLIASGTFEGMSISELVQIANQVIGGCSNAYNISALNEALTGINENFDGGANQGFVDCVESDIDCSCEVIRTWTATDDCENESTFVQYFILGDNEGPQVVEAPQDVTIECGDAIPQVPQLEFYDDCSDEINWYFCEEEFVIDECTTEIRRVWSVNDGCNASYFYQTIYIQDTTAPVLVGVPSDMTGLCDDNFSPALVTATDVCDEDVQVMVSESISGSGCDYTITYTYTATDDCGNSVSDSYTITVIDLTAPVLSGVPANETVSCDNIPAPAVVTATDNCDEAVVVNYSEQNLGGNNCTYQLLRTWSSTDACGNTATQTQTITVTDSEDPTVVSSPENLEIACDELVPFDEPIFADNCDDLLSVSFSESTSGNSCVSLITRTWTATDNCGNDISTAQTITIVDTVDPYILSAPSAETTIECGNPEPMDAPVFADSCDPSLTLTAISGITNVAACGYDIERTWTATDDCGNTISFSRVIHVVDTQAPVFSGIPSDETVNCDEELQNTIVSAFDQCDGYVDVSLTASTDYLECGWIMVRTWTAVDACGNIATASQTVTVIDETDPYIVSAPDAEITINCGEDVPNVVPVFADNCDNNLDLTFVSGLNNVTDCSYDIEREWTATDDCDNTISFTQNIHVIDVTAPIITCPADFNLSCDNINYDPQNTGFATATDECSEVTIDYADAEVEGSCPASFVRTWTATDVCGNVSSCEQLIYINDNEAPIIECVELITIECGNSIDPFILGYPTASDNCSAQVELDYDDQEVSGGCVPDILRTWTATDACGNESICVQVISIIDTTAPVFSGEDADLTYSCEIEYNVETPTVYDACDEEVEVDYEFTVIPGDCPNERTEIYQWTAIDECENTSVRTITVHIIDETAPVLYGVPANETVNCDDEISDAIVFATDNCDEFVAVSLNAETNYFDCGYEIVRTWYAVDACGNDVSATQIVTVVDIEAPYILSAPSVEVTIECGDQEPMESPVFADNCDNTLTLSAISGINNVTDCGYDIERSWTATDDCGNSTTFSRVIHVLDTTAPEISCPANYTVNCDGGSSHPDAAGYASATDICSEVEITYADGPATDDCPSVFTRTWTATDVCGNSSSCTQMITINDFAAPVIDCPADITVECTESLLPANTGMATATDDCSEPLVSYTDGPVTGDCPYSFERTWTAVDPCGNSSSCTQIITIIDTQAPVITGEDAVLNLECNVQPSIITPTVSDNCDEEVELVPSFELIPGDCPNNYTEVYSWTAIDHCGNVSVRNITVNFDDTTDPVIYGVPANDTVECDAIPTVAIVTADDNCGEVDLDFNESIEEYTCGATITRTWTAVDECGNTSVSIQILTVVDTTNPYVIQGVPAEVTIECDQPEPFYAPVFGDNCDGALSLSAISGINNVSDCGYDIERSWTATDDCGNSFTVSQVIHVIDTTSPVLSDQPADITVLCTEIPSHDITASDNCDDEVEVEFSEMISEGCPYTITRNWYAADDCGNNVSYTQIITVIDTEAPTLVGVPADVNEQCGMVPMAAVVTATDNCDDDLTVTYNEVINSDNCPISITRTWSVTDDCGNTTSASQNITINDTIAPEFDNYSIEISMPCDDVDMNISVVAIDNCDQDVTITFVDLPVSGGCAGRIIRDYTAVDNCGNEAYAQQIISLIDVVAPVIDFAPANFTVECGDDIAVIEATFTDNCDNDLEVSYVDVEVPAACGYIIERTWSATDHCENVGTYTQIITVEDTTEPVLSGVPANDTVSCDDIPAAAMVSAEDVCDGAIEVDYTEEIETGICPYTITRTWTAVDACGNTATATQILTVIDTENPVLIGVPSDVTVECDNIPSVPSVTADDNCSENLVVEFNEDNNYADCDGSIVRTWSVTDNCGNTTTLSQTISIIDETAPIFEDYSIEISMPCDDVDMNISVVATDNCDQDVTITFVDLPVSGGCAGRIIRDYTAVDNCGNEAYAQQIISLIDVVAPVVDFAPADFTVECGDEIAVIEAIFTDNCDDNLEVSFADVEVPAACGYTIERIWTATDHCENVGTYTQIITVIDTTEPVLSGVPSNETVSCDDIPAAAMVSAEDVCDGAIEVDYTEEIETGVCPYTITRTWTAVDACGNTATATQILTVIDTENPVLVGVPADETVECDNIPSVPSVTADDNCSENLVVEFNEDNNYADCDGSIVRTWSVTDNCGNTTTLSQTISIIDETAPIFEDYSIEISMPCDDVDMNISVVATDNCDQDVTITFVDLPVSGGCAGRIIRDYTAVDNCGNEAYAQQIITLIDVVAPVIDFAPADFSVECGDAIEMLDATFTDNCDEDFDVSYNEIEIPAACGYTIERTWTATDQCDNVETYTQIITVIDTVEPVLEGVPANDTVSCDAIPAAADVTAEDVCDGAVEVELNEVIETGVCPYTITRTWTATDACGNAATATQIITVIDTENPVLVGTPIDVIADCNTIPAIALVTATDNCDDDVEIDFNEETGEGCDYNITRTWIATDNCGNQAIHIQVITVVDDAAPIFEEAEVNLTISCDELSAYMLEAYDNCDDQVEVTYSDQGTGVSDPEAEAVCEMETPLEMNGVEWATWLQGFPFGLDYYDANEVHFLTYPDGTAHLIGHVTSYDNTNGGWDIDVWFMDGVDWNTWDNMPFPTNYKDDENLAGDNYQDWTYYILNGSMSTMTGTGDFEGSILTLTHAPVSKYYAFQLGIAANNVSAGYGLGGWFYYNGIFMDSSTGYNSNVSGAGDFAFEGNCCNADDVTRTWVAIDDCGNESVFVQNITVIDEDAPEIFNVPESIVINCGDDIPAAPENVYAIDNCDVDVDVVFSETQSAQFCPYVITRTWTVTDDCGNVTVATQTITVAFEAAPVVFMNSYPNPFDGEFNFEFSLPSTQKVDIKVVDGLGKTLAYIFNGEALGGTLYQFKVTQLEWEEGMYTIMLMTKDEVHHIKMLSISK